MRRLLLVLHSERIPKSAPAYLLLTVAVLVYLHPFVRELTETPDAGIFLNGAALVTHGAIPSRDFVEVIGPGTFLWLALFFRVFGTTLLTAQALLLATGTGISLLAFHLSRGLGGSGLFAALFAAVMSVSLLPHNSPHYDSMLFALAAFAIFLIAWRRMLADDGVFPVALLATAGSLAGLTSWFIQPKGLYLSVALGASILFVMRRRGVRCALVLLGSYIAVVAAQFAGYALLHALPDLIYANYVLPLTSYRQVNAASYGFPVWQDLWPTFLTASKTPWLTPLVWMEAVVLTTPFLLVMALPLLLPVVAYLAKMNPMQPRLLPYWLAAYAIWLSEIHRVDIGHLRNGCILMVVLFFAICETSSNQLLKNAGLIAIGCLVAGATSHLMATRGDYPVETRRGTAYMETPQPVIGFLQSHTKPGDDVFVYPYQPVYYFLADVHNPTRYNYLLYNYNSAAQFMEATQDLERRRVRYVLYDNQLSGPDLVRLFPAYRHPEAAQQIMEPYLAAHYRKILTAGRFQILERADELGALRQGR